MNMTVTYVQPWWGGWMYRIVTGVTLYVDVPLTYLVLPISFRVASPALEQSHDCPSASEATLKNMGNYDT